jgi:hypothetical protein
MLADLTEANRPRFGDQEAEDAAPVRELTDRGAGLVIDAHGEKALERGSLGVENPEGCVASPGQLTGGLEEPPQDRLEVQLGDQRATHVDQPLKALLVEGYPISSRDAAHA